MYNRKTIRLQWYDYSSTWKYFVTICTKNRVHYFGEIADGFMKLNALWKYTYTCWKQIEMFHPHVAVDAFICMPNHVHGIITIGELVGTHHMRHIFNHRPISNHQKDGYNPSLQLQCLSESLWSIIRWFKIGVTQYAKQNNLPFERQSRFHDYIIRDQCVYDRIVQYIKNNPQNWKEDRFW